MSTKAILIILAGTVGLFVLAVYLQHTGREAAKPGGPPASPLN